MRKNHQTGNLKSFLSDVRPEAGGASFQTKRTQNISMLSPARIYYVLRIILGYGLPERETCCMLSFCRAFEFLPLYKRTFRFTPAILEDCTVPRIRSGFLPTQESVYMLNSLLNLHQALEQTGETTRACRFCLQVLNFLQMEGRSAFYRKFLRISSIKELWAMTRRH